MARLRPQEHACGIAEYRRMRVGTFKHRDLFCRSFIEGHRAYEPENLPWPDLEPRYLERLRAIPFWGIARAMEHKAGSMVRAFAATVSDPVIREAVELQGVEEARHAGIMTQLIKRYGLTAPELDTPAAASGKADFVQFGYEECVDFFMGAGLFRLARQVDIFPANLVDIFEDVLIEEARHVTFFINWYRYEEARAGRDGLVGRHVAAIKNYNHSIRQLIRSFDGVETTGFAAANAKEIVKGMTPVMFLEAALAENRRMLGLLDPRLVKPSLLPVLAATALTALRALPPRNGAIDPAAPSAAGHSMRDRSVAA